MGIKVKGSSKLKWGVRGEGKVRHGKGVPWRSLENLYALTKKEAERKERKN